MPTPFQNSWTNWHYHYQKMRVLSDPCEHESSFWSSSLPKCCILGVFKIFFLFYLEANYFTILYWFCHTLTWIRHECTCVNPPPTSLPRPSLWVTQCTSPEHPVSCIEAGLVIRFTYDNIHVSVPFSQIISPSPSPTEYKRLFYTSVPLLLSHIQCYHYHLSKFHIYALVYCISIFLSGLLHSV